MESKRDEFAKWACEHITFCTYKAQEILKKKQGEGLRDKKTNYFNTCTGNKIIPPQIYPIQ